MFGRDTDSFIPEDKSHENTANSLTMTEREKITELRGWLRSEVFNETVFQRGAVYIADRTNSIRKQTSKYNKFGFKHFS